MRVTKKEGVLWWAIHSNQKEPLSRFFARRFFYRKKFTYSLTPDCVASIADPYNLKDPKHKEELKAAERWKKEAKVKIFNKENDNILEL